MANWKELKKYVYDRRESTRNCFHAPKGEKGMILTKEIIDLAEMERNTTISHRYAINTAYYDILGINYKEKRVDISLNILEENKGKYYPRMITTKDSLTDAFYYVLGLGRYEASCHAFELKQQAKALRIENAQRTVHNIPFDGEHTKELVELYKEVLAIDSTWETEIHIKRNEKMVWNKTHTHCLCCGKEMKNTKKSKYNYCGWCLKKIAREAKEDEMGYKYEFKGKKCKTLKELASLMEIPLETLKKYLQGKRQMPLKLYDDFFYLNNKSYDDIKVKYEFEDEYYIEVTICGLWKETKKRYKNKEDLIERSNYNKKEVDMWFYKQAKAPDNIRIKTLRENEDVTNEFFLQ